MLEPQDVRNQPTVSANHGDGQSDTNIVALAGGVGGAKLATGLPRNVMFYHKTGWFSYWTNDVGIVDDGHVRYIIACFLPLREKIALPKMKMLSRNVYDLMKKRR